MTRIIEQVKTPWGAVDNEYEGMTDDYALLVAVVRAYGRSGNQSNAWCNLCWQAKSMCIDFVNGTLRHNISQHVPELEMLRGVRVVYDPHLKTNHKYPRRRVRVGVDKTGKRFVSEIAD